MPFDSRILSLTPFEPHRYEDLVARRAFVTESYDQTLYENGAQQFRKLRDVSVQRIEYMSDGLRITGTVTTPSEITAQSHPILMYNRGGNGEFGIITAPTIRAYHVPFAREGYLVFASNYRGNDGGEGSDEFGGADVRDVLNLLDIAKHHPGWDGHNIFMLGGSRGGTMTFLAIKHGATLNAAASFAGPSDVWQMLNDRPRMAEVYRERIPEHEAQREAEYEARSATRWANQLARVPLLLLLHGTADERVTLTHTEMLDAALTEVDAPHKMVIFEGGNHSLSTHRPQFLREVMDWFTAHRAATSD